ncbi:MAG: hypothetical protein QXO40_03165 [Candidatus Aenigmatarchaeota archaeon]
MRKSFIFLAIFLFLTFLKIGEAQIILRPGSGEFVLVSIRLNLVEQDYTGSKQYIGILGDKSRLDIFWDAEYQPAVQDPTLSNISVTCWLNCNATNSSDISICSSYKNCSYLGPTGFSSCSISNPNYNYSSQNIVLCKFSNPNYPNLEFVLSDGSYPRRVFYPIRYSVSSVGGIYPVGSLVTFPISFLSYSFLKSNYTAFIYIKPENQNDIYVDNSYNTTRILKYGELDTVYPKLSFLIKRDNTVFYINTTSNELPTFSSLNLCPSPRVIVGRDALLSLINGKCIYSFEVTSGSTYYSMPEYDFLFSIIILIFSALIFYSILKFR